MKTTPTTQTALRLVALALTTATSIFAQTTPGFEPSISPAVHLTWSTTNNKAYQVITTTNLSGSWITAGPLMEGTGGPVGTYLPATNHQRYFRVQQTNATPLSWLHGTWVGPACQTGPSIPLYEFTTRLQVNATNRVFTIHYSGPFRCDSVLTLLSYSDNQAVFHETVQSGACFDETVMFTRISPNNLAFHFVSTNPAGTGGGLLIKQ